MRNSKKYGNLYFKEKVKSKAVLKEKGLKNDHHDWFGGISNELFCTSLEK